MGTQIELVARRSDGSEVMVEIALSPLQSHGLPLVVAAIRDIGAYPRVQAGAAARPLQRIPGAGSGGWRSTRATRRPCSSACPAVVAEALQVELAMVVPARAEPARAPRRQRRRAGCPASRSARRSPTGPTRRLGFVLAQGRPITVDDYAHGDTASACRQPSSMPGLSQRARGAAVGSRAGSIGVLDVRSRKRERFGDDEVRFLESLANLLATSLQRAQSEEALEPRAAARERRPADRRHRPRLQQPADRDPGQPAGARGPAGAWPPTRTRAAGRRGHAARRGAAPS